MIYQWFEPSILGQNISSSWTKNLVEGEEDKERKEKRYAKREVEKVKKEEARYENWKM